MEAAKSIEVPSRRFGRYVVKSRLGSGGMAEVFRCEVVDEQGRTRNVALKLMREGVSMEAFADEADLMGLLSHPNLVQRLEFGEAYGRPFIAMEFLMGGDLLALLRAHRREAKDVPLRLALHVTVEVLKALAYFHQARTKTGRSLGLVHSDVNPSNVFFSGEGEVKLGDYGVAKSGRGEVGPKDGQFGGKLHYLAPELARGEGPTPRSDLFAVGVMLYELAVGYHPYDKGEEDPEKLLKLMKHAKLPAMPDRVPAPVQAVLERALAEKMNDRYDTCGDMAAELFRFILNDDQWMSAAQVRRYVELNVGLLT